MEQAKNNQFIINKKLKSYSYEINKLCEHGVIKECKTNIVGIKAFTGKNIKDFVCKE